MEYGPCIKSQLGLYKRAIGARLVPSPAIAAYGTVLLSQRCVCVCVCVCVRVCVWVKERERERECV